MRTSLVFVWTVLCCTAATLVLADATVTPQVDEKTGASTLTVANGLYRIAWVAAKGRTPTIARAWAGNDVPVGSLFDVSWGLAESGEFKVVEPGPVRVVLAGEFRVKRDGDETVTDLVRIRAEHWDGDPRIAIVCDFELGKDYPNKWILCHNFLRLGGDVAHADRWVAGGPTPKEGTLEPLPPGSVATGKRDQFILSLPWGEIYRTEPSEKAVGVGGFTDRSEMIGEHYWHESIKTYAQERRLWFFFRMNGAFKQKYRQAVTLVLHPGTIEPQTKQSWTGYCYDRFTADGTNKGVWLSPVSPWEKVTQEGKEYQWAKVEVIEELGLWRGRTPVEIPVPPDLPDRERVQVSGWPPYLWTVPSQWNADKSAVICQDACLRANDLTQVYLVIPPAGTEVPREKGTAAAAPIDEITFRIDLPGNRRNYLRGEVLPLVLSAPQDGGLWDGTDGQVLLVPESYPSEPKWTAPPGPARSKPLFDYIKPSSGYTSPTVKSLPFEVREMHDGLGARLRVSTHDVAAGEYRLIAQLLAESGRLTKVLRFRLCPPSTYRFEIGGWGDDCVSQAEHNLSTCILTDPKAMDDCLRLGMKFSLRTDVFYNTDVPRDHPEARMKQPDGKDMPLHTNPSVATPCLLNSLERDTAIAKQRAEVSVALPYPAMSRFMYTSDDVHLYSWCCYCDTCKRRFKELTGLDAPQPPTAEQAKARQGVVPESEPWLLWNLFRCGEVYAGYNRALVKATQELVPDVKLGAVSGPMQRPLLYPSEGLNPAQDQGAWTLLNYYYYPHHLFPLASNIFYTELSRLGGREKEAGTLGDCYGPTVEQAHIRNSFYCMLAAGNHTMQFFTWPWRQPEAAEELKKLGQVTRRFGNLFLELERSPKPVGLLCPFTTAIYNTEWAHASAQASFLNLLCAHIEAEPVGEEEIMAGAAKRYKAVIVADVGWLRQACFDKLVGYVKHGGTVLVDATTKVDIPGAKRLDFGLATAVHYATDNADPLAFAYADTALVAKTRDAVAPLAPPFATADSPLLHLRRFQGAGATYLFAVNAFSREEFSYLFKNCQFWRGEKEWMGREKLIEYLRTRGAYGGRFAANVNIPAGDWAVYDVLAGKRLDTRADGDRLAFTVDVERFGGTLLALYPASVAAVQVRCKAVRAGKDTHWLLRVLGPDGKPVKAHAPIELMVTDPGGRPSEYSGYHVARAGELRLGPIVAVNDLRGTWRVRATELASGVGGEASFEVREP